MTSDRTDQWKTRVLKSSPSKMLLAVSDVAPDEVNSYVRKDSLSRFLVQKLPTQT